MANVQPASIGGAYASAVLRQDHDHLERLPELREDSDVQVARIVVSALVRDFFGRKAAERIAPYAADLVRSERFGLKAADAHLIEEFIRDRLGEVLFDGTEESLGPVVFAVAVDLAERMELTTDDIDRRVLDAENLVLNLGRRVAIEISLDKGPRYWSRRPATRYGQWYLDKIFVRPSKRQLIVSDPDGFEALGGAIFNSVLVRLFPARPTEAEISDVARGVHSTVLGAQIDIVDIEATVRRHFGDDVMTNDISLQSRMRIWLLIAIYAVKKLRLPESQVRKLVRQAENALISSSFLSD